MIGEHRPRFKLPTIPLGEREEKAFKQITLLRRVEQVFLCNVPAVTKYTALSANR
jgi:hypothetical protein